MRFISLWHDMRRAFLYSDRSGSYLSLKNHLWSLIKFQTFFVHWCQFLMGFKLACLYYIWTWLIVFGPKSKLFACLLSIILIENLVCIIIGPKNHFWSLDNIPRFFFVIHVSGYSRWISIYLPIYTYLYSIRPDNDLLVCCCWILVFGFSKNRFFFWSIFEREKKSKMLFQQWHWWIKITYLLTC